MENHEQKSTDNPINIGEKRLAGIGEWYWKLLAKKQLQSNTIPMFLPLGTIIKVTQQNKIKLMEMGARLLGEDMVLDILAEITIDY